MALGFFETNINGREVIAHGGDTGAFHTVLHLFLDDGVGLYVSFNSGGRGRRRRTAFAIALFEQFADRYFPAPAGRQARPEGGSAEACRDDGRQLDRRRARADSTFLSITELIGQTKVSRRRRTASWSLPAGLSASAAAARMGRGRADSSGTTPTATSALARGRRERRGRSASASSILSPFIVFERTPWYKNSAGCCRCSTAEPRDPARSPRCSGRCAGLVRRYHGATLALEGRELLGYRLSRIAALAILLILVGWVVLISLMFGDLDNLGGALRCRS